MIDTSCRLILLEENIVLVEDSHSQLILHEELEEFFRSHLDLASFVLDTFANGVDEIDRESEFGILFGF
jgi:hypothetical protein